MAYSNRPHKKLKVWNRAMDLAKKIYSRTEEFPTREQYGLAGQLRRAAVSVPSNIAEGLAKGTSKDKVRFLLTAQGSLSEIDTQIELSGMIGYLDEEYVRETIADVQDVQMLLSGLIRTIRQQP